MSNAPLRTLLATRAGQVRHEFVMGKSGSGKSEYILSRAGQHIEQGGGLTIVNPKPDKDFEQTLYSIAKACGRAGQWRKLDIYHPEDSHSCNIFMEGDVQAGKSTVAAIFGAAANADQNSKHFLEMLLTPVTTRLACIKELRKAFGAMDLYILLNNPQATQWLISQLPPSSVARKQLEVEYNSYIVTDNRTGIASPNQQRWQSQIGGGANRLFTFATERLAKVMSAYEPTWTIDEAVDQGLITYIPLPMLEMPDAAVAFAKMILTAFRIKTSRIYESQNKPLIPHYAIFDEFGSIAIPESLELVEKMRGANIGAMFAFQTYANLLTNGPDFASRLIGNCEMRTFFTLGDSESRVAAAELVGELLKDFESRSASQGKGSSNTAVDIDVFHRISASTSSGEGAAERYDYAVRPERFRDLPIGQAIMVPLASRYAMQVAVPMMQPAQKFKPELPVLKPQKANRLDLGAIFDQKWKAFRDEDEVV